MNGISFDPGEILKTNWTDHLWRFIFGAFVTTLAGVIGFRFGPTVGGLFLAFPAIFPAGLALLEKDLKREEPDSDPRQEESDEAAGALLGVLGLAAFAAVVWAAAGKVTPTLFLLCAGLAWLAVAGLLWLLYNKESSAGRSGKGDRDLTNRSR